jgi:hypothetical protein
MPIGAECGKLGMQQCVLRAFGRVVPIYSRCVFKTPNQRHFGLVVGPTNICMGKIRVSGRRHEGFDSRQRTCVVCGLTPCAWSIGHLRLHSPFYSSVIPNVMQEPMSDGNKKYESLRTPTADEL